MGYSTQSAAGSRISRLLDDGSFVELGAYVTARSTDFNMADKETPADGVLTGYGTIGGSLVYVYSQDAAVLGGSMGEMHARKIVHLYKQAIKMGAPVIGLIDCAGLRLQEATDALNGFGRLYLAQTMASGVIPQIQAVFGMCGGGMAVSAALADFTFMEEKKAQLFVNSPNAIEGNHQDKLNTASAAFQSAEAGLADFTGSEDEILSGIRDLITVLPANNEDNESYDESGDDLNRLVPEIAGCAGDTGIALALISDGNFFIEARKNYAPEMVTGFIRLNGQTVGAVANRSEVYEDGEKKAEYPSLLTPEGCRKAAEFVNFCDAFEIPVLTLTNVTGYKADKCTEKSMARSAAALTSAFADATVPKVNVIVGKAFGTAYLTMNSSSIGADMTYAWPTASIGMMDPKSAASIICGGNAEEVAKAADEYAALQGSVVSAARRGYVDDIIEPQDTRKRAIAAFEMLFTKREDRPAKKHGSI